MLRLENWSLWVRRAGTLMALVVVAAGLRLFVARGLLVRGESMEPTLLAGDVVLVNRAAVGLVIRGLDWAFPGYSTLEPLDLLVVRAGGGGGPGPMIAKRLVGMPGDVLYMADGALYINGRASDEPYATPMNRNVKQASIAMRWQLEHLRPDVDPARYFPTQGTWGPLRIPEGHYFVLGDNRDHSIDSRELGFVHADDVVGRVDRILFSHDRSCCDLAKLFGGVRWERIGYNPAHRE
jgi:signal peptidase I